MYLELVGIPTDKDLQSYPSVHLTSPHEWDPTVLDYVHPSGQGEPSWNTDPNDRSQFEPKWDGFGDYVNRAIQILNKIDDIPQIPSTQLIICVHYTCSQLGIYRL